MTPSSSLPVPNEALALPELELPSAFLRCRPVDGTSIDPFAALSGLPGICRLDEFQVAVYPVAGRGQVFSTALALASYLIQRAENQEKFPGLLIFPGILRLSADGHEAVGSPLLEDLSRRGPDLEAGGIFVTGYVASWLAGRYRLDTERLYEAPSGRRVPIRKVLGAAREVVPWHNRAVLGHRTKLPRENVAARLRDAWQRPIVRVTGSLGAGKTVAVWQSLDGPKQWIGLGYLPGGRPQLAPALLRGMAPWLAGVDLPTGDALLSLPITGQVDTLCRAASGVSSEGALPTLLVDDFHLSCEADLALISELASSSFGDRCRLALVSRTVDPASFARYLPHDLPHVEIPPFEEEEMARLFGAQLDSMELPAKVRRRFLDAAAGRPFAFEEGLVRLLHEGKVRSVYGSYFYAGSDKQAYEASERLMRHGDAEAGRLGAALHLRIMALSEQPRTPAVIDQAASRFGVTTESWHEPYVQAGWLAFDETGSRLVFAYPAMAQSLRQTVSDAGRGRLRHALGAVLADSDDEDEKWAAYRLMAGSPEALPPLLEFSRASGGAVSTREEVFFALLSEHREAVERGADAETELQVLWALLPLARRLGKLAEVDEELRRGVELARGDGQKWVALVALLAELDMERGEFRQAEKGLREALSASEGSGQQRRATLFVRLGALLLREERYDEATQIFEQLLPVVDQGGPSALGASCRYYLGNIALYRKQLDAAKELHSQAAEYRRRHRLSKPLGASLSALGLVALTEGNFPTALDYYADAEATYSSCSAEPWELGDVHLGKGRALRCLGEITRAGKPLRSALEACASRGDTLGEAEIRLEMARLQLDLEQPPAALDEARRAHFLLSLASEISLLGDAERVLARILLAQKDTTSAELHLREALRIHKTVAAAQELAEDHALYLEWATRVGQAEAVAHHAGELRDLLEDLELPSGAERLFFQLFLAFHWLESHGEPTPDPLAYLRRAYQELMRKTAFLAPERRHAFLYQLRGHQAILDAAARRNLSLPVLLVRS